MSREEILKKINNIKLSIKREVGIQEFIDDEWNDDFNKIISYINQQPTITNEQVKEDIERVKCLVNLLDEGVQQEMVKDDFKNITQYIAQLEVELMKREATFEILSKLSKNHTMKLDKIEGLSLHSKHCTLLGKEKILEAITNILKEEK